MRILPVFIPHAGCTQTCVYCNQVRVSQSSDHPTPDSVQKLVAAACRSGRVDEVAFYGGSFSALPVATQSSYLDAVQPFIRQNDLGGIRFSTRPDALDSDGLERYRQSGVTTIELGCQSFCGDVLSAAGRGHSVGDSVVSARLVRDSGLSLGIQLMPGLPGASSGEALSSLGRALDLSPDFLRIYPTVVLADTFLAELWRRGEYEPLTLDEAVDLCSEMRRIALSAGVPVVRFGLQANEGLEQGGVVSGPYHPAFGQLVKSRQWRDVLLTLRAGGAEQIGVHPADLSDIVGHGRNNLDFVRENIACIRLHPDPSVPRQHIGVGTDIRSLETLVRDAG